MENFDLKKFLTENKLTSNSRTLNENVEVEEVTLGNTRFAVEEPDPLDDGTIISISKHKNGYFITGEVQDEDGNAEEGYGYGVDFEGNIIEDIYDAEDLDKETDVAENKVTANSRTVNENSDMGEKMQFFMDFMERYSYQIPAEEILEMLEDKYDIPQDINMQVLEKAVSELDLVINDIYTAIFESDNY